MLASIKRGEPCCMSCSPPQATCASPRASSISPWLRSAHRTERTPPKRSVRSSTRRRQSSLVLACGSASQCVRRGVSGLPSLVLRSSAAAPRLLQPDILRYPVSGAVKLGRDQTRSDESWFLHRAAVDYAPGDLLTQYVS